MNDLQRQIDLAKGQLTRDRGTLDTQRQSLESREQEASADAADAPSDRLTVAKTSPAAVKPIEATRRILDGLNLAKYFGADAVLGGDGPLPRKPDPAGLHALCRRAKKAITMRAATVNTNTSRTRVNAAPQARS